MKYIVLTFLALLQNAEASSEKNTCDVFMSKEIDLIAAEAKATINVNVQGSPCYKASLNINVILNGSEKYTYQAPFKPHVAIHWEDLTLKDVQHFVKGVLDESSISNCGELLSIKLDEMDGWNYNKLLVSEQAYNSYNLDACTTFTHPVHYEAHRVIVIHNKNNNVVAISEHGL